MLPVHVQAKGYLKYAIPMISYVVLTVRFQRAHDMTHANREKASGDAIAVTPPVGSTDSRSKRDMVVEAPPLH
jgi:hypothetical protein